MIIQCVDADDEDSHITQVFLLTTITLSSPYLTRASYSSYRMNILHIKFCIKGIMIRSFLHACCTAFSIFPKPTPPSIVYNLTAAPTITEWEWRNKKLSYRTKSNYFCSPYPLIVNHHLECTSYSLQEEIQIPLHNRQGGKYTSYPNRSERNKNTYS